MAKRHYLTVLTPDETLLDADVAWVQLRLADGGGIGIYPGHAPLLAETAAGPLRYADESGEHALELEAGVLEVHRSGLTLFTSGTAPPGERAAAREDERLPYRRLIRELLDAHERR
jgi:F-type H+-transporting ATPase subunit epsilon